MVKIRDKTLREKGGTEEGGGDVANGDLPGGGGARKKKGPDKWLKCSLAPGAGGRDSRSRQPALLERGKSRREKKKNRGHPAALYRGGAHSFAKIFRGTLKRGGIRRGDFLSESGKGDKGGGG